VDDEPAIASIIKYFINANGLPIDIVAVAENGIEALELIRRTDPHLVFLDIVMPGLNGFQVIQEEPGHKYIIVTAYASFEFAQQALRLGASDILLKPIDYEQFVQAIERAMGWQLTSNPIVNETIHYIHEHYAEDITLGKLAMHVHTSPSHLTRQFKKHTGFNIFTYVHRVRIQKAKQLLSTTDYSIKEVAKKTGYNSINNFYKYFRLFTGMTPAAFIADKATGTASSPL
jgi:two-component system response regulator YesN